VVREWGVSDAGGAQGWGPHGPVFLGEDLVHKREYSDQTAREIDQEVARIIDTQLKRATKILSAHRGALDAVAGELEARETLEGREVERLVTEAEGGSEESSSLCGKPPELPSGPAEDGSALPAPTEQHPSPLSDLVWRIRVVPWPPRTSRMQACPGCAADAAGARANVADTPRYRYRKFLGSALATPHSKGLEARTLLRHQDAVPSSDPLHFVLRTPRWGVSGEVSESSTNNVPLWHRVWTSYPERRKTSSMR
jgi:hypothetical protein